MIKTYGLAIEKPFGLVPLKLDGLLTLAEAERDRAKLAWFGHVVHVVNVHAA